LDHHGEVLGVAEEGCPTRRGPGPHEFRLLPCGLDRRGPLCGPAAAQRKVGLMAGKAVISLSTGLEDAEKVSVAFLVAVGAAESGRPTLMFLAKEAVRLALTGNAIGTACDGCPPLADLVARFEAAGGRYYVCPVCFNSKQLDGAGLIGNAELQGTVPMWDWIGDEGATTFSY
jgi:predicted peroxiredoxin